MSICVIVLVDFTFAALRLTVISLSHYSIRNALHGRSAMEGFTFVDKLFFFSGALGSAVFLVRLVAQFVMGGGDDMDAVDAHDGLDSILSFKLLTLQGIT